MKCSTVVLLCLAVVASASSAQAQGKPATAPTGGKEQHPMAAMNHGGMAHGAGMAHGSMAASHAEMMKLQRQVIAAASAAEGMSHAKQLNVAGVRREADRSRDDLKAVLQDMDKVESTATAEQKEHMAQVRTHEQEALKHAEELVSAANAAKPEAAAISTHAKAVLEHAREAEKLADEHAAAMKGTGPARKTASQGATAAKNTAAMKPATAPRK